MNPHDELAELLDAILPPPPKKERLATRIKAGKNGVYTLQIAWRGVTKQRALHTRSRRKAEKLARAIHTALLDREIAATARETAPVLSPAPFEAFEEKNARTAKTPRNRARQARPAPARKKKAAKKTASCAPATPPANDYTRPCRCFDTPYTSILEAAEDMQIRPQTLARMCAEQKYGWQYTD